jgi:hypothetical protein
MGEIDRYALITPILDAAAERYEDITHWPQCPLRDGVLAQGYPDWAFIYKEKPIFIVEAKIAIDDAIAQNVLRVNEAHMKMRPGGDAKQWTMYGMGVSSVNIYLLLYLLCIINLPVQYHYRSVCTINTSKY